MEFLFMSKMNTHQKNTNQQSKSKLTRNVDAKKVTSRIFYITN